MNPPCLLAVGLDTKHRALTRLSPRLLHADGSVTYGEGLPSRDAPLTTLGQRVTWLAQVTGRGLYACEVVTEPAGVETPIIAPTPLTASEVPAWAADLLARKGWSTGGAP